MSERNATYSKSSYKKLPYSKSVGGTVSYAYESAVEQTLGVTEQDKLTIRTDWITKEESLLYKQVISSPSLFLDLGSGQGYASVRCTDSSYATKMYYNEKLIQLTINLEYCLVQWVCCWAGKRAC